MRTLRPIDELTVADMLYVALGTLQQLEDGLDPRIVNVRTEETQETYDLIITTQDPETGEKKHWVVRAEEIDPTAER